MCSPKIPAARDKIFTAQHSTGYANVLLAFAPEAAAAAEKEVK